MTSALVHVHAPDEPQGAHRPPRIQAVCLDIDDTLIDFTTPARKALRDMIGRDDMWPKWQRMTEEHVARVVAGELDADAMRVARTRAFLAEVWPSGAGVNEELACRLENRRCAELAGSWTLFEDVLPCLDWLRAAGLRLAAVTNASGPHQRAKLRDLGIARFFDAVVIAGELGVAKPDPRIFQAACTRLDVPVAEALHIGDRLDVDAVAARDAGLHGVWLTRTRAGASPNPGIHTLQTLSDLPELLIAEFLTPTRTHPAGVPGQRAPHPVSGPHTQWSTITDRRHGR